MRYLYQILPTLQIKPGTQYLKYEYIRTGWLDRTNKALVTIKVEFSTLVTFYSHNV